MIMGVIQRKSWRILGTTYECRRACGRTMQMITQTKAHRTYDLTLPWVPFRCTHTTEKVQRCSMSTWSSYNRVSKCGTTCLSERNVWKFVYRLAFSCRLLAKKECSKLVIVYFFLEHSSASTEQRLRIIASACSRPSEWRLPSMTL